MEGSVPIDTDSQSWLLRKWSILQYKILEKILFFNNLILFKKSSFMTAITCLKGTAI